ncbi:MAG: peptidylprolyl isomerase [Capsulimonadaceae bacterium]|nr:peptidylprolyl isomerase [Capsulimonadaceae bacterium]
MSLISIRKRSNNMSRVWVWIATGAMIIGGGFMGLGSYFNKSAEAPPAASADDVIAKVNGEAITRAAYVDALERYQQQMSMYGGGNMSGPMASGELHSSALTQAINQVLLLQIAKSRGLQASSADIDAQRKKALDSIGSQLGLKPGASQSEVDNELAKTGQTFDHIVPASRLESAALMTKYNAAITRLATPSDAKVAEYYTSMHTEHILIGTKSRPDAQALDQAKKIVDLLNKSNGANFEQLAKQYSDDPGTKAKGGDDGWINGQTPYVDEFMNGARTLKVGAWSQTPVKSPQFGYFIIKLLATRDDTPKDFAKKKADYVSQIASSASQKLESADMDAAQKAMKVVVLDPQLAGDWALMNAFKDAGATGGKPAPAVLNSVAATYDKALKKVTDSQSVEQIQAQRGMIFRMLDKPDDQLKAFEAAAKAAGGADPDLALQLGDLYKKAGKPDKAIQEFQIASKNDYDNAGVHVQLLQDFKDLNRPDLAAAESKWLKSYSDRQKAMSAQAGANGQPISLTPKK